MKPFHILPNLRAVFIIAVITQTVSTTFNFRYHTYDQMKCSYGERGSLTATCVNATAGFFKTTPYRFDHLDETLKCVNCALNTIEMGTFDLIGNQIKNLDIHNCQIDVIKPKGFVGLIFLETLDLSHNQIYRISPGTFSSVKKITKINLSYNNIDSLVADAFAELVNLESLNLQHNQIKNVPPKAFSSLGNLASINFGFNLITTISPNGFDNLTRLMELNFTNNFIQSLTGNEFYNLSNMLVLDLSSNHLINPLFNITAGNRLKRLLLSENEIEQIVPNSLNTLTNLQFLDLSRNTIYNIAVKTFRDMYELTTINLSGNRLTELKTNVFSGIPLLEVLNCSHNQINTIDLTGVFLLNSLYTLDISYNNLTDLDYSALLARLPKLSYLELEENPLPCDLEEEMNEHFSEDNFKFVLFKDGSVYTECSDPPLRRQTNENLNDVYIREPRHTVTSGEIWIFVFLSIAIILLAILFYMQYRTYSELKNGNLRSTLPSTQILVSQEDDPELS